MVSRKTSTSHLRLGASSSEMGVGNMQKENSQAEKGAANVLEEGQARVPLQHSAVSTDRLSIDHVKLNESLFIAVISPLTRKSWA
mmetsp:Transcript_25479/g.37853  ORF Transcript_25479/g.37853 Transcript_25479/m.37853 type:complete len:85 (-) Transcript_25479:159-413(-)